ncbi:hypothetical protein ACJBU6_02484 [Exserohilum turcicum]
MVTMAVPVQDDWKILALMLPDLQLTVECSREEPKKGHETASGLAQEKEHYTRRLDPKLKGSGMRPFPASLGHSTIGVAACHAYPEPRRPCSDTGFLALQ